MISCGRRRLTDARRATELHGGSVPIVGTRLSMLSSSIFYSTRREGTPSAEGSGEDDICFHDSLVAP